MRTYFNIINIEGTGEDSFVEILDTFSDYDLALEYLQKLTEKLSKYWVGEYIHIRQCGDYATFLDTMDPDKFRYIGIRPSYIKIND